MTGATLLGLFLGAIGATMMNVGKGVQKLKVHVFAHRLDAFRHPHRSDLYVWGFGWLLTTLAGPFISLGMKYTSNPSMVTAMTGVGLVALLVFSARVLEERVGRTEITGVSLVIVGVVLLATFYRPMAVPTFVGRQVVLVALGTLVLFLLPVGYTLATGRLHGPIYGALAGALMAIAMVLGKVALIAADHSFIGQLRTPWVYAALLSGTGALVVTQVAFVRGRAVVVVPTLNSIVILAPIALERVLLDVSLQRAQYLAIATIVAGVILITATHDLAEESPVVAEPA